MGNDSDNMRKFLNVLSEDGPLAPGVFVDPLAAAPNPVSNLAVDDPMDDVPTTGPETKIEVTMKDGDDVEVEVYAKQGDELKRIMDLAGVFHKDKQGGTLAAQSTSTDVVPVGAAQNVAPEMSQPDSDYVSALDYDDNEEVSDISPEDGLDVPVGADIDDMSLDMDDAPEIDFELDGNEPDVKENMAKINDFGHKNPRRGQEEYDLAGYGLSGEPRKPVRYVPARSGDNPLKNNSDRKSLKSYMNEIANSKKKVLAELANDEEAENTVSKLAVGVNIDDNKLDKLKKVAKDVQQGVPPSKKDSEKMDSVLDAADAQGVVLNPNEKRELEKNVIDKQKEDSIKENDFKLSFVDEDELEERKRRYSFSPAEYGRGIITSPESKRRRSAKRGLSIYKK